MISVWQAPIGRAGSVRLVRAVGAAGGLGIIAGSWLKPAALRTAIRACHAADAPFAVNLVLAFAQAERVSIAAELRVPYLTFSWGVDASLIDTAHNAGCVVAVQVGSVEAARAAVAAGADMIITQGVEAGGHVQGTTPLLDLLAGVRAVTSLPLVAAGGIVDAETARTARRAGAAVVMAGTRFVASQESAAHPAWKQALINAGPGDTILCGVFDGGWPDAPHRVLHNSTVRDQAADGWPPPGARRGEGDVIGSLDDAPIRRYDDAPPTADTHGAVEAMALYAGDGAARITSELAAADIVAALAA